MKLTEQQLLGVLNVSSNLSPNDFEEMFGTDRGRSLFTIYANDNWNTVSFMFNKINGDDRKIFLERINSIFD